MTSRTVLIGLAVGALLTLSGCGTAGNLHIPRETTPPDEAGRVLGNPTIKAELELAPPPQAKDVYYYPVTVGSKWVYLWNYDSTEKKDVDVVEIVTDVKNGEDGAKIVTTSRVVQGRTLPWKVHEISNRGLFYTKMLCGGNSLGLPFCELKLPHQQDQIWKLSEFGDAIGTKLTSIGPEKIKVPAGEFECIRVESRDVPGSQPSQTRWYAPGIGMVKITSGDLIVVLKSFTPGKE